jgi:aryl-alcohol dehydrogenase-like predicted oxidoreductase
VKYSRLGNTGPIVSRLAFGAMTFTRGNQDLGSIYKVGAKLANELVGQAIASKPHQLKDNLAAADLTLTAAEISELDAATPVTPVYPNWFIENLADRATAQALGGTLV